MKKIKMITMKDILMEEFLKPLNLSVLSLSEKTGIPESTINRILNGDEKITIEISRKLGMFFSLSERYFSNLQKDIDRRNNQ